jgi:CBS domain containing-hemolysin-like protein
VQDQGQITGIFTSKDVVLRVIAAGLDPANCSVIRVMTPHPDFAPADMSIQQALRKMHDGHYLNLPVMNKESDEIVGMVDVLKLTYATLDQVSQVLSSNRRMSLTNHRSTACQLAMVKVLHGTSSGCLWVTTRPDR